MNRNGFFKLLKTKSNRCLDVVGLGFTSPAKKGVVPYLHFHIDFKAHNALFGSFSNIWKDSSLTKQCQDKLSIDLDQTLNLWSNYPSNSIATSLNEELRFHLHRPRPSFLWTAFRAAKPGQTTRPPLGRRFEGELDDVRGRLRHLWNKSLDGISLCSPGGHIPNHLYWGLASLASM